MSLYKQKDPQNDRRWQWLTDQHGRTWGCVIELATGDPTGPIDLYDQKGGKVIQAPVMPPPAYRKVDSRKAHGELEIDYSGWKAMQQRALDDFDKRVRGIAQQMFKDRALQAIEERDPALFALAGIAPEPIEPILAAEAGDPWALGLTDVRPDWADLYMPTERPKSQTRPKGLEFLDYKKPTATAPAPSSATLTQGYPAFVKGAGRGLSVWKLSDGSEITGKRADAEAAEAALNLPSSTSVGSDVHASWRQSA